MIVGNGSYFADDSIVRKIFSEKHVSGLAGVRALLIQGLQGLGYYGMENSQFFKNPLTRAISTAKSMETFYFGTKQEADAVAARVNFGHSHVKGLVKNHEGSIPDGTVYDANDPDQARWVIAAVMDSAIAVYGALVAPLSAAECDQFVREYQTIAKLLGAPDSHLFNSYAQLLRYMQDMYATIGRSDIPPSQRLELTERARRSILKNVFDPDIAVLKLGSEQISLAIRGVLPPVVRRIYRLDWTAQEQAKFDLMVFVLKGAIAYTRATSGLSLLLSPCLLMDPLASGWIAYASKGPAFYRPTY